MNAIILAAGFGTRLRPWTDRHPKALVPVAGVPMLQRVLRRLENQGFKNVVINTHHFSQQIKDFICHYHSPLDIKISDETDRILNTGGGVLRALAMFDNDEPVLVHNVDILSDAPLKTIYDSHKESGRDISLITSPRQSSRKLIFDKSGKLAAWHDLKSNIYRPEGFRKDDTMVEHAFSGMYVIDRNVLESLSQYSEMIEDEAFPVMDYFLWVKDKIKIGEMPLEALHLIDIGKPDTLAGAESFISEICCV